jgi:hypothetical protein
VAEALLDHLQVRAAGQQPRGMSVPKVMNPDVPEPSRFPRRKPYLVAKPVGRDMPVRVAQSRSPRAVRPASAPPGAVVGVRAPAVLAPAPGRVVSGQGAMPVPAAFSFGSVMPGAGPELRSGRRTLDSAGGW